MNRIRWGLCCVFMAEPVKFRTATHAYVSRLDDSERWSYLRGIAAENVASLRAALETCARLGIGAFRVNSQFFPLATHPVSGYTMETLDPDGTLRQALGVVRAYGDACGIRRSFHPDQFVVLGSEREDVVTASVRELDWQAGVADLIGADVVVVHAGSAAGGMDPALERLQRGIDRLGPSARRLLALENDDRSFTPELLLPLCETGGVPLVYDVHHHRCRPDGFSIGAASDAASATWRGREPYFHISSPKDGWDSRNPRPHADYIDPADFPPEWRGRSVTIDVEAKAKELAVLRIMKESGT
jgi:UV DNA damage endonuclease